MVWPHEDLAAVSAVRWQLSSSRLGDQAPVKYSLVSPSRPSPGPTANRLSQGLASGPRWSGLGPLLRKLPGPTLQARLHLFCWDLSPLLTLATIVHLNTLTDQETEARQTGLRDDFLSLFSRPCEVALGCAHRKKTHLPTWSVGYALHKRYDSNPRQSTDSLAGQLGETKCQPRACPLKAMLAPAP